MYVDSLLTWNECEEEGQNLNILFSVSLVNWFSLIFPDRFSLNTYKFFSCRKPNVGILSPTKFSYEAIFFNWIFFPLIKLNYEVNFFFSIFSCLAKSMTFAVSLASAYFSITSIKMEFTQQTLFTLF